MKTMQTNAYRRKTNFDNTLIELNADQQPEMNSHYSWKNYTKTGIVLVGTFATFAVAKTTGFIPYFPWSDQTDVPIDDSYSLVNLQPDAPVVFTDNTLSMHPRHAKRAGFGVEIQINTYTINNQDSSSVAGLTTGNFVVVWESYWQDGSIRSIYGQRYSSLGVPQGSEFQINTYTTSDQFNPAIAALSTGDFVAIWQDDGQDGDMFGVFGQRFSSTGVPQGSEFQVNSYTTLAQGWSSIAGLTTGDFVVVWHSDGQDGDSDGIYGQCYSSTGVPQGSEFQVNSYTLLTQYTPSVAALNAGNFAVVWTSLGQDGDNRGIYGQRFSSTGVPQGSEFQINTYTTGSQNNPSVAALNTGDFVVVWHSDGQDGSSGGIYAQRFSSTGIPQGNELQVNTYTTSSQSGPSVAALNSGDFVVTWRSYQDGDGGSIYGQRYSNVGIPQGSEFQINTYTAYAQLSSATAALSTGDFVITWTSSGQDGDKYGIYGRIYFNDNAPPALINNALIINEGETIILSTSNLSATDSDNNDADLTFIINNVQYGQFERVSNPGIVITNFTQQEIIDGAIQFVHDGSENQPSYDVRVSDGALSSEPAGALITFSNNVNDSPQIATNAFPINQGGTVILTSSILLATDSDNSDNTQIQFFVTDVQNGRFENINNLGAAISDFTQDELLNGKIQFVHDNSEIAPSFNIAVTDGSLTSTITPGNVIYTNINDAPYFTSAVSLTIQEGQAVTLTSANLQVNDIDNVVSSLVFTVSGVTHGQFESSSNPGITITSFTQAAIQNGEISFVHDGSSTAPSFFVTVSDGVLPNSNGPQAAAISFTSLNDTPTITVNTLTISEGGKVILTSANLQAADEETAANQLIFNVANIMHGQFENINNPGVASTSFSQQSIINGDIQFVHNGDEQAPSYDVAVTDGLTSSAPQAATINFTPTNDAPILVTNELTINQDATKALSHLNIKVTDDDNPASELTITITTIKNGYFSTIDIPNTAITQFTQQDVNDGKIQFTQQGTEKPSYTLTVSDRDGKTSTQNPSSVAPEANINFAPKTTGTSLVPIVAAIAGGTAVLAGSLVAGILYFKKAQDRKTRQQHKFAQLIRRHLALQKVDNFDSEDGQRFIQAVEALSELLQEEQGIDITNMDENRLGELASNIATSAKNKITPDTTGLWNKSKISITDFADNIEQIARDNRLDDISYAEVSDDVSIPMHTM